MSWQEPRDVVPELSAKANATELTFGGLLPKSTTRACSTVLENRGPIGFQSVTSQRQRLASNSPSSLSMLSTTMTLSGLL